MPLNDMEAMRLNEPMHRLMGQFIEQFQQKVLDKGKLLQLLHEYQEGNFRKGDINVKFPAAKDGLRYPAFSLNYGYFYKPVEKGFWGVVPALALQAFAESLWELEEMLEEAINLEFAQKKRLAAVQRIVSAIWYEDINLHQDEMLLRFPTPSEIENEDKEHGERLLPQLAKKLAFTKQVTYGRKTELKQVLRAMRNDFSKNVLLVGASGVGKTALIGELTRKIKEEKLGLEIWQTSAASMIKELMRETGWQDNLGKLCKELAEEPHKILFVRNLMELFEVGQYAGNSVSVAAYLRTYLSRGEITMISECTKEELAQIELKSPQYISLFHIIRLEEPKDDLEEIILQKVSAMATAKKVNLSREAVKESIRLHRRFTPYSGFPGKPIRFIESLLLAKTASGEGIKKEIAISRAEIIQYFCEETGMPPFIVDPDIPMDVSKIIGGFNQQVFGQKQAVQRVGNLLASIKTALIKSGKPIASFLFVGPTGVGKTELAKVLAEFMFARRDRMIRFDMSEYSTNYDVMRLIGSVGASDGILTAAVRREPFAVLLFDEIEKAHSSFYDLLLQILDAGRLTDNRGKVVNFCSTIIIMTSNIGASRLQQGRVGFGKGNNDTEVIDHFMGEVKRHFRPELYNRIDEVIPFVALTKETVRHVVDREIALLRKREGVQYRNMNLTISGEVLDYLGERGYDSKYGARQLQRAIREELIIPLSYRLNLEEYDDELEIAISSQPKQPIAIDLKVKPMGVETYVQQWDAIMQADYASDLRRSMQSLQDGGYYLKLENELEELERLKKKQGVKFWENPQQGARYTNLMNTSSKTESLRAEIEEYEMDSALACMELDDANNAPDEELLKAWETQSFDLKVELYTRLNLKSSRCYLGIYGRNFDYLLDFYLRLFEGKEYTYEAETIWFHDKHYNMVLQEREHNEDWDKSIVPYLRKDYKAGAKDNFKPPVANASLHGIEFLIDGNCAYLYLASEEGIQRWKMSQQHDQKYKVEVYDAPRETPLNIHRKIFYQKQAVKRMVEPNRLKDPSLRLDREYNRGKMLDLIVEQLDEHFKKAIDEEVL